MLCAWCYGPRRAKSRGDHGRYCSDTCRSEANRAPKAERQRRHEEARKRMGLSTAAENNRAQRAIARWVVLRTFADPFSVSDVRAWCGLFSIRLEWTKPWTGSLFQHEWFECTGRMVKAYHPGSNAREVKEWRLTEAGWNARYEMRRLFGEE
jgi:hypothetical protein